MCGKHVTATAQTTIEMMERFGMPNLRFSLLLCGWQVRRNDAICCQNPAVGKSDGPNAPYRCATLDALKGHSDHISGLKRSASPAEQAHVRWILGFDRPVGNVTVLVFDIKFQKAVGIGPGPFGDGALQLEDLFLEARRSMMCQKRH